MKKVLILLDGIVAQALLKRLVQLDTSHSMYDIVYMNDKVLCDEKPQNFTFYQFDPTSFSKLKMVMSNSQHSEILLVMSNKHDTLAVVDNIRNIDKKAHINVFNQWSLTFEDEHIHDYNAVDVLANGLIE
ncbi:MAG TPA: potassium transporter TrkA, partial [Arcobacter sp.]|nr:potassium transporter TrkA [Arcobacter sp.]